MVISVLYHRVNTLEAHCSHGQHQGGGTCDVTTPIQVAVPCRSCNELYPAEPARLNKVEGRIGCMDKRTNNKVEGRKPPRHIFLGLVK